MYALGHARSRVGAARGLGLFFLESSLRLMYIYIYIYMYSVDCNRGLPPRDDSEGLCGAVGLH